MSATSKEREEILGAPTCDCGKTMQFISMDPEADGLTEHWNFRCSNCGAARRLLRERE
jgi:hypothetical protein